jgi:gamma-glutamyl hydrolase
MIGKALILTALVASAFAAIKQTPVIGIYTQDSDYPGYEDFTYIASSYVKSMEMTGVQVVPIFYHYTTTQLQSLLGQLNGVVFPGGEMPIDISNQWTSNTKYILEFAMNQTNNGNPYPIWATCLGYEALAVITSQIKNNMSTLTRVHGEEGSTRNLTITMQNSKLFGTMAKNLLDEVTKGDGLYYFHHNWAVLTSTFRASTPLSNFWNLVSTSVSPAGEEFVSTLEAKNYPFFASQYHPEKNPYEWRIPAVRTYNAILIEQWVFNIFAEVARQNKNTFKSEDELKKLLIYNYQPLYTTPDYDFVQIYTFNETSLIKEQMDRQQEQHLQTE